MTTAPTVRTSTPEERFVAAFELHEGHTLNGSNARIQGLRKDAIESFKQLGLPGRKDEAWKYTNIEKALRHEYRVLAGAPLDEVALENLAPFLVPGLEAHRVVLVNGRFVAALSHIGSLPEGVIVTGFAKASEAHADLVNTHFTRYADFTTDVFAALNTAFAQDGLFVYVPKNVIVETPIQVINLTTGDEDVLLNPRSLVVVEQSGSLKLVEGTHTLTEAKIFTNAVSEFFVGPNARVDHYLVEDEGANASRIHNLKAHQEADSYFSTSTITLSGDLVRNDLHFLPDAENCETHLFGLFLGKGRMHIDNHTLVDHAKPNCYSNELFKGVLDDASTGVFNGKVFVRPDAQQTNAYQSNKTIVLTEQAQMFSKPELEIYADDVKCSHGATTGQLEREAIFYLRSRGLTEERARTLLLLAFARDVLEQIKIDALREHLDARIAARFAN